MEELPLEPQPVSASDPAAELYSRAASVRAVMERETNRFTACLEQLSRVALEIDSPIAVVGGLAAIRHGARVTTLDVDIVIAKDRLDAMLEAASNHGFRIDRRSARGSHRLTFLHPEEDVSVHVIPEGEKSPRDPQAAPPIPGPRELQVERGIGYAAFAPWVEMKLVAGRDKDRYHLIEVLKNRSEADLATIDVRLRRLDPRYLGEFERLVRAAEEERNQENCRASLIAGRSIAGRSFPRESIMVGSTCASFATIALIVFTCTPGLRAIDETAGDTRVFADGGASFSLESARDGSWSDPSTWEPSRAPAAGDQVLIRAGHEVIYDAKSEALIPTVRVAGRLRFARDRDTLLTVGLLRIDPNAADEADGIGVEDIHDHDAPHGVPEAVLEVGTPDAPVLHPHSATIRLAYVDGMPADSAPAIICRPGGRMEFHGAPMSRTWVDLGGDAKSGTTRILLGEAVTGWREGDALIVTGSEHESSGAIGGFRRNTERLGTEERRIASIDGQTITLDRPLAHDHTGSGRYRSEVANLSRTVVIESADPGGVRGHTMFHEHSAGAISYARFAHLGKEGVLGRYSIHFHRVRSTMRGSSVVGAAIVDSHNRWITIHSTEYLVVRDCVGYRSIGHGFFLEDGTETYNVLDRNLGVQAFRGKRLPRQVLPFDPNDGAAFWWANGRNTFIRNTSAENDEYGFRYDSQKRSNFDSNLPVLEPDGSFATIDIRTIPVFRFEGNEAHSEGLYGMVFAGTDGAGPDTHHPHRLRDLKIWQVHYGLRAQLPSMWVERVEIDHAAYGIYRPWFENHVYRDLTISFTDTEPFNRGLDDESMQHGSISIDGLTFRGIQRNDHVPYIQISANNVSGRAESHFRGIQIVDRRDGERRALVNLGGGPRLAPATATSVPVYLHDYFGPGRHAKIESTRAKDFGADGLTYREDPPLTGDESRVAEVNDVDFPVLLEPTDDLPPATVITWPRAGLPVAARNGTITVEGTTTDDFRTARVIVNGIDAGDVDFEFHRWRAVLPNVHPGKLTIEAHGIDAAGNVEKTPHRVVIDVESENTTDGTGAGEKSPNRGSRVRI